MRRLHLEISALEGEGSVRHLLASDGGRRLWMLSDPIQGVISYEVLEKKSGHTSQHQNLEEAVDQFNDL